MKTVEELKLPKLERAPYMHGSFDFRINFFQCFEGSCTLDMRSGSIAWEGNLVEEQGGGESIEDLKSNNLGSYLKNAHGQFAVAFFDKNDHMFCLARDQFGVVPLYYAIKNEKIFFGTRIESVLCQGEKKTEINRKVVHEYFLCRYISGIESLFENVYEVKPGSVLYFDKHGNIYERFYYVLEYSTHFNLDRASNTRTFAEKFWKSLLFCTEDRDQKRIGVLSSGGVDSSILVSSSQRLLSPGFATYYAGYEGYRHNRVDEVAYLSKLYNTTHTNVFITGGEFADSLIDTIRMNEEPLNHPSSVARKLLCERIQGDVDVLLSGEGADCLYCGYYVFNLMYYCISKNPVPRLSWSLAKLIPVLIFPEPYRNKLQRVLNIFTMSPTEYMLRHSELISCQKKDVGELISFGVPPHFLDTYKNSLSECTTKTILNKILNIYQTEYLVEALKTITKLGAAFKIEHRHPFIDQGLVDFFNGLDWREKVMLLQRKHQIVELGKSFLPKEFLNKPKEGFGAPLKPWFYNKKGLGRFLNLLDDDRTLTRGIFETSYLKRLLDRYHSKRINSHQFESIIWPIINMELWCRIFLDGDVGAYE